MDTRRVYDSVGAETVTAVADDLWEHPELSLQETRSADVLVERLRSEGFSVEGGVAGLPTGFVAQYGEGEPAVGIVAEYDALPNFSQKRHPTREPVRPGDPGHACGHNLFAAGSLGGAIAVKDAIESGAVDGRVLLYGCPAEEVLVGKTFMAREGLFDDLDAALSWHAGDLSWARMDSSRALKSLYFEFRGTEAHTRAPEEGRSALDAVQLLNTGVEYMREHIPEGVNVSHTITDGGSSPGIVPAKAGVWYYVRAPTGSGVEEVTEWITDIAGGAATMTRTDVDRRVLSGCHGTVHNRALAGTIQDNLERAGPIEHSEADLEFARELAETVPDGKVRSRVAGETVGLSESRRERILDRPVYTEPLDTFNGDRESSSSTDIGNVSRVVPLGRFRAATWPVGVAPHTWQAVAASGTLGKNGAVYAAKVLAGTAVDLFESPDTLRRVQEEFAREVGEGYDSPVPAGTEPPLEMTGILLDG